MARARLGLILAIALSLFAPLGRAVIVPPPLVQPAWIDLSGEQRRVLAPLASEWDMMGGFHRKRWLGIAVRYPSLSTDEQVRVQRRMTDWAKLTPEQRKQARDKFKSLQSASPEKKEAVKLKWQEYKELPESEKSRLKDEATRKPMPHPIPAQQLLSPQPQGLPVGPTSVTPGEQASGR